jgi:hypothetical protein
LQLACLLWSIRFFQKSTPRPPVLFLPILDKMIVWSYDLSKYLVRYR